MNKLFFLFSLWTAKLTSFLISILHLGQASNLPGKIALLIQKDLLKQFKIKEGCKIILITGTNGKSTTCGLLASTLQKANKKIIYNKSGANLLSGIASAFCHYSNIFGGLKYDYIIFEVDEATLPLLTKQLNPSLVAVTNFFRDQLDRFGELDTTVKLIEEGINNTNATIVLNADDPRVAFLKTENKKIYYGIDIKSNGKEQNWLSDLEEVTIHDFKRPEVNFLISDFKTDDLIINFNLIYENHRYNFFLPMIGVFNLYNTLCAISIAKTISDITQVQIQKGFDAYKTIFGRGEKINNNTWIYLIKNPKGATEVLKALSNNPHARFLIAINDNYADGRDISWLWDARFDMLSNHKKEIFVSGRRAYDMALRLKYANIETNKIKVKEKIKDAINEASFSLANEETLYILPTYTVLLEMQRKGICKEQPLN